VDDGIVPGWRLLQVFLDATTGVHEVDVWVPVGDMRCTCSGDGEGDEDRCEHIRWVLRRIEENGGIFPLMVDEGEDPDVILALCRTDPEGYRTRVREHGWVETLDPPSSA
jgi:hypothetical protein